MTNHRHAYLIMAHTEWQVLNTLLQLLDDARNDIFLHIDRKVKVWPDLYRPRFSRLIPAPRRHDVRWGDVGQIHTEMMLFRTAHAQGPYQYYHLLSGVDLPIKNQDEIHDFFDRHQGEEFVGFARPDDFNKADIERKCQRYYFLMRWNYRCTFEPAWKLTLAKAIRYVTLKLQDWVHMSRGHELTFRNGYNWVSLTEEAVSYLLSREDFIRHRFAHTSCADEIYKHSLLISHPVFSRKLHDVTDANRGSMRYIDFLRNHSGENRGEPYNWQDGDSGELLASPYLFARKFSSRHSKVIGDIVKAIRKPNTQDV